MLTRTTEMAIRALVAIGIEGRGRPTTPRELAARCGGSPTYLSKTLGRLVRAGILQSVRGARGGFQLGREPSLVRLLDVVMACQGVVTASFCERSDARIQTCAFHRAMRELHDHAVATLSRWTLADLIERPARADGKSLPDGQRCRMFFEGCERHAGVVVLRR